MTTPTIPAGADAGEWDNNENPICRHIWGRSRHIDITRGFGDNDIETLVVYPVVQQEVTGRYTLKSDDPYDTLPGIGIDPLRSDGGTVLDGVTLNVSDARQLAAELLGACDELESWLRG